MEKAIFGAGCFWCIEAMYVDLIGVSKVVSGYMGGNVKNPCYREICEGNTGHAEVCQVEFDPEIISYDVLLDVFWTIHDPTTLNQQGHDIGTQYRSVIFYSNEIHKKQAETKLAQLELAGVFPNPITTEVNGATIFYPADNYHQEYFKVHGNEPYCNFVIKPKYEKLKSRFKPFIKPKA